MGHEGIHYHSPLIACDQVCCCQVWERITGVAGKVPGYHFSGHPRQHHLLLINEQSQKDMTMKTSSGESGSCATFASSLASSGFRMPPAPA